MGNLSWTSIWRPLCGLAAVATAIAVQLGANDLNHPDWHGGVATGTLQFAHWCYVAALVLALIAGLLILVIRNVAGTSLAWFTIAFACLTFFVGGLQLVGGPGSFTPAGAGGAMVLGLVTWGMVAVLLVLDVKRSANPAPGRRQVA